MHRFACATMTPAKITISLLTDALAALMADVEDGRRGPGSLASRAAGRRVRIGVEPPRPARLPGSFVPSCGKRRDFSGHTYRQGAGYTFETQHFPNSPNQPNFPSTEIYAGQTINSTTIFQFSS